MVEKPPVFFLTLYSKSLGRLLPDVVETCIVQPLARFAALLLRATPRSFVEGRQDLPPSEFARISVSQNRSHLECPRASRKCCPGVVSAPAAQSPPASHSSGANLTSGTPPPIAEIASLRSQ